MARGEALAPLRTDAVASATSRIMAIRSSSRRSMVSLNEPALPDGAGSVGCGGAAGGTTSTVSSAGRFFGFAANNIAVMAG